MGQSIEKILCFVLSSETLVFLSNLFAVADKEKLSTVRLETHRMLPSVFVQLLFCFACEAAFGTGIRPLPTMVHQMLF